MISQKSSLQLGYRVYGTGYIFAIIKIFVAEAWEKLYGSLNSYWEEILMTKQHLPEFWARQMSSQATLVRYAGTVPVPDCHAGKGKNTTFDATESLLTADFANNPSGM